VAGHLLLGVAEAAQGAWHGLVDDLHRAAADELLELDQAEVRLDARGVRPHHEADGAGGSGDAQLRVAGPGPAHGTLVGQMHVEGFKGKGLVNSFYKGDGTTGTIAVCARRSSAVSASACVRAGASMITTSVERGTRNPARCASTHAT